MIEIHLDFETFSEADLKNIGAYKYASHPSTEILLMAVSIGDRYPTLFVPKAYGSSKANKQILEDLATHLPKEDTLVFAHNAPFEIAITKYLWEKTFPSVPAPRLEQWRCTASLARRAGLPASLKEVAKVLRLEDQKDKKGSELIRKFSIPQKLTKKQHKTRIYPLDDQEAFFEFGEYCVQDVIVEREVHKALKGFMPKGSCLEHFLLDLRVNDRGIPVNVPALKKAQIILKETSDVLNAEFEELTGLKSTQRAKVQSLLLSEGYPFENMQSKTVELAMKEPSWMLGKNTKRVMELYSSLSYASVGKIKSMLECECGDGFVRGTLQYYGASTGRWSGKLIQPQNFKRATIKSTEEAYKRICGGATTEEISLLYGNPIEVLSSCIRHFIQPHKGSFFQADYAAVEARIVCWLAGQQNALDEYYKGFDRYKLMASAIFKVPVSEVTLDQRWFGKQAVLGCGFQLWWVGFQLQCATYGVSVDDETAKSAVIAFRDYHNKIVDLWKSSENAAKQAIMEPGKWFRAGDLLSFACSTVRSADKEFLFLRLPSGRMLAYPAPTIEKVLKRFSDGKLKKVEQIFFYGAIAGRAMWGRTSTYGGKLVENATQAVAADLMANGSVEAERKGFVISTLIHDEALAYAHPTLTVDDFCEALCTLPVWAKGLPLVAEGKEIPYYLK